MKAIKQYRYFLIVLLASLLTNLYLINSYDLKGLIISYANMNDNQYRLKENKTYLEDYTSNERNNLSLTQTNSELDKLLQSNDTISSLFEHNETLFFFICPPGYKVKDPVYSFVKSLPCQTVIVKTEMFKNDSLRSENVRSVYLPGIKDVVQSTRAFCFFMNKNHVKTLSFTFFRIERYYWDNYVQEIKTHIENKDIL